MSNFQQDRNHGNYSNICIEKPCVLEATRTISAVMAAKALVIPTTETCPLRLA